MDRIASLKHKDRINLANKYNTLITNLGLLEEKQTIYDLAKKSSYAEAELTPRKFRTIVEDIMYLYMYGNIDYMVVGNAGGYIATNDIELLERLLKKKHHQFLSLSKNFYSLKKFLETRFNMSFDFEEEINADI
ncbi:MAG TPA: hypothetical protein PKV66_06620 [Candidatus Pelethenecus sp.]|nr:hypothetical protein [Candidatus Pelethenecus sp.]